MDAVRINRPLSGLSPEEIKAAWKRHIKDGYRPEEFHAVRDVKSKPPDSADVVIISRVSHNKKWDDLSLIQCNVCGNPNKFKDDGYVGLYPDGWLYIIGPKCGEERHRKAVIRGIERLHLEEAEKYAGGALKTFIDQYDDHKAYLGQMNVALNELFKLHQWLRKHAPNTFAVLNDIRQGDGRLRQVIAADDWSGYSAKEFDVYGALAGKNFFRGKPPGIEAMRKANEVLNVFFGPETTIDTFKGMVAMAGDKKGRKRLLGTLNAGKRLLKLAHDDLDECRVAIEPDNFSRLAEWSRLRNKEYEFRLVCTVQTDAVDTVFPLDDCVRLKICPENYSKMSLPRVTTPNSKTKAA